MDDDLNITSKFGKKIKYNLKENNNIYENKHMKSKVSLPIRNKKIEKERKFHTVYPKMKKYYSQFKFSKLPMKRLNKLKKKGNKNIKNILPVRQAIYQINSELKLIELEDKERKKSFYKNEFFPTQINTFNNNKNETSSNKNRSVYDPMESH